MNLFQADVWFKLHSGKLSQFKIECDSLTDADWDSLALVIARQIQYSEVVGVPTGGLKLEKALRKYKSEGSSHSTLIVDDVLTTGKSMVELRDKILKHTMAKKVIGVVVFSRGKCPKWVTPIFQMDRRMAE